MKYTVKNIYIQINKYIDISKKDIFLCGIMLLSLTSVSFISPYLYKVLVDEVMTKGEISLLYILIPSMIVAHVISVVLSALNLFINRKFVYNTDFIVKRHLMKKFLARNINCINDANIGKQSSNIESDSQVVSSFLYTNIIGSCTYMVISCIYIFLMIR